MDCARIRLGIAAWFLGAVVPVAHHVLLHWPLAGQQTDNIVTRAEHLFKSLPWIVHAYFIAMAVVGAVLVVSGMRSRGCGHTGS